MTHKEPWYLGQRAEQLAIVYLTRSDRISFINRSAENVGFDFTVRIKGQSLGKIFGIEVKAVRKSAKKIKLTFTMNETVHYIRSSYPMGIFLFIMENDVGYFSWLVEPVILSDNSKRLVVAADILDNADNNTMINNPVIYDTSKMLPLNDETLEKIISQVDKWYDVT